MAIPKSVTRVTKDGVKFISNVDQAQYTITELQRAALRDSAKFLRKSVVDKIKELPGMKRHRRPYSSTQYWVRKWETDLLIGFKHDTWYGADGELGRNGQPARNFLRDTVFNNIDEIRKIQGQYLSEINKDNMNRGLISEEEYVSPEGEE